MIIHCSLPVVHNCFESFPPDTRKCKTYYMITSTVKKQRRVEYMYMHTFEIQHTAHSLQ